MRLAPDEIHLWLIPESLDKQGMAAAHQNAASMPRDAAVLHQYEALLCPEERQRYHRFLFRRDRLRFLETRAAVRLLLSRYQPETEPAQWAFKRGEHGRPELQTRTIMGPVSFNVSHSSGMIVLALTTAGRVGVDIERQAEGRRITELAQRYFAEDECAGMLALEGAEREQRFYDLWTLKEAYVKAYGAGLKIPLRLFTFSYPAPDQIQVSFDRTLQEDPERWLFWQLHCGTTHTAAVALHSAQGLRKEQIALRIHEFELPGHTVTSDLPVTRRS